MALTVNQRDDNEHVLLPLWLPGETSASSRAPSASRGTPSSRPRFGRMATRRDAIVGALALAAVGVMAAAPLRYRGRLLPGTSVDGIDLSGMTRAQAHATLTTRSRAILATAVTVSAAGQQWNLTFADLGVTADVEATLDQAYAHGRKHLADWYQEATGIGREALALPFLLDVNVAQLDARITALASTVELAAADARFELVDGDLHIVESTTGRQLDRTASHDALMAAIQARGTAVELPVAQVSPGVTAEDLEPALQRAQLLISRAVTLTADAGLWQIAPEDLAGLLTLGADGLPTLDDTGLDALLQPLADEVATRPRNALLWADDAGDAQIWEDGEPGLELDVAATREAMLVAMADASKDPSVALQFAEKPANVRSESLVDLGITTLLARGKSSFAGSAEARRENVRVAAGHVSRTLIPPGGEWSFNDNLGAITPENGYVEGHSIQGNWYTDDIGGGVCQISTTVFRAALFAGFRFSEWNSHAFRIAFYELDGSPPGIDAAIFQPNTPTDQELDLVIVNPTDSWAYVQTLIDEDEVTAELYGTPVDYETVIEKPEIGDPIDPPAPQVRVDPEMAPTERKMLSVSQPGYDVFTTRRFMRDGEELEKQVFASYYQPQPEMWIVGSKVDPKSIISE